MKFELGEGIFMQTRLNPIKIQEKEYKINKRNIKLNYLT